MKKSIFLPLMACLLCLLMGSHKAMAQNNAAGFTTIELQELFGYCEKPILIGQLKLSGETADKIGAIYHWARWQYQKIADNTNDTFATASEVEEAVVKKCKALGLSGDQLKGVMDLRKNAGNTEACPLATLFYRPAYDTIAKPQMVLQLKTKFRKKLMETFEINGKQADMVIDVAVWEQKEAQLIAQIPSTDFNRIRKTVELHKERDRKYSFIGLTDQQKGGTIQFFQQNL